jgi:hypothetical protein
MIFNQIDERTAKISCEDNCIIWACKMGGVDQETIDHMKYVIKTRYLPQSSLKIIAKECKIEFRVRLENKKLKTYKPDEEPKFILNLLLIDGHYMINEEVRIAPYFINHYDAIMNHAKLSKWTFPEKQLIHYYDVKKDVFEMLVRTDPVKKIVKALKVSDYLKSIHHGDY